MSKNLIYNSVEECFLFNDNNPIDFSVFIAIKNNIPAKYISQTKWQTQQDTKMWTIINEI